MTIINSAAVTVRVIDKFVYYFDGNATIKDLMDKFPTIVKKYITSISYNGKNVKDKSNEFIYQIGWENSKFTIP